MFSGFEADTGASFPQVLVLLSAPYWPVWGTKEGYSALFLGFFSQTPIRPVPIFRTGLLSELQCLCLIILRGPRVAPLPTTVGVGPFVKLIGGTQGVRKKSFSFCPLNEVQGGEG